MPPVRWKLLAVIATCLVQEIAILNTAHANTMSMTADGWRPIIGTHREQLSGTHREQNYQAEITHYRNPSKLSDPVKAEQIIPSTQAPVSLPPPPQQQTKPSSAPVNNNSGNNQQQGTQNNKIASHSKPQSNQYFILPSHVGHGPHIPLGPIRGVQNPQHIKQFGKIHGHGSLNGKRHIKPIRLQAVAHSTRDEVYVPAPNGAYSFYNPGQSNVKTREVTGISVAPGIKPYRVAQLHSHIDFSNHFALPGTNDNIFQQFTNPLHFVPGKHPQQNEISYAFQNQYDDFSRNLVPPPYKPYQDKQKLQKQQPVYKPKEPSIPVTEATINDHFVVGKPAKVQSHPGVAPENVVLQLPPPFEQQQQTKNNEQAFDVQITKENFNVFHNNAPVNFNPSAKTIVEFGSYQTINKPSETPPAPPQQQNTHTYEVTEGKLWPEQPIYQTRLQRPRKPPPSRQPQLQLTVPQFLPTPYSSENLSPTIPTQNDAATVFTELSKKQKLKEHATKNPFFDIKEISTHFPILGKPEIPQTQYTPTALDYLDFFNEITTKQSIIEEQPPTEYIETTEAPTKPTKATLSTKPTWQRRPNHRRRRPSNRQRTSTSTTTTTTEEPRITTESIFDAMREEEIETTEPPKRYRRPTRIRTTTPVVEESTLRPTVNRHRYRTRPRTTTPDYNENEEVQIYKSTHPPYSQEIEHYRSPQTTEREIDDETHYIGDFHKTASLEEESEEQAVQQFITEYQLPNRFYERPIKTTTEPIKHEVESTTVYHRPTFFDESMEEETRPPRIRGRIPTTPQVTTEELPTTNLHIPEEISHSSTTIPEVATINTLETVKENDEETTLATTPPTTTSSEASTTKSHRIRGRPVKYGSNRPRFSVKEYRQRLNQYTSTSTSTTESYRSTSENTNRMRYSNRLRRPNIVQEEEDTTESMRVKFKPKDPRHGATTETSEVTITDKPVKVNTRLRPFGRYRSTTEATSTTPKVSIKTNIFSNLRRPPPISLRTRIYNRNRNSTKTTEAPAENNETSQSEIIETTVTENQEITTEYGNKKHDSTTSTENVETDILKNESFMYSQRVSDLTSSAKNDYNTPGVFKSVSPTSRRIPSYFTIATDDPILPIEAFFPNLKDKEKQ